MREPSGLEIAREGIGQPVCTRPGPMASTATAATSEESIPPDSPMTTSSKPFFCR